MSLSLIVAMTEDRIIGKDNTLPWHISEDLKRFKKITMGHPIIMGRNTFESIGKVLPGRQNIIVSRGGRKFPDGVIVVGSIDEALKRCDLSTGEEFVIGGAQLYSTALPLIRKFYITLVRKPFFGNIHFPKLDLKKDIQIIKQEDVLCDEIPVSFIEAYPSLKVQA